MSDPASTPNDAELRRLLESARTIAVVGASSTADRPSFGVFRRLKAAGFHVVPVNPFETEVQGEKAFASLADVPYPLDIVDVFRRAEETPAVADAAVAVHAKVLWLQLGIANEDAAERARRGGLVVVMDACIAVVVSRLAIRVR
jgi:predicted CoA-binding protein